MVALIKSAKEALSMARVNEVNSTNYRIVLNGRAGVFVCVVLTAIAFMLTVACIKDATLRKDIQTIALAITTIVGPIFMFLGNNDWVGRKQFRDKRETHGDYERGKAAREQEERQTAEHATNGGTQ